MRLTDKYHMGVPADHFPKSNALVPHPGFSGGKRKFRSPTIGRMALAAEAVNAKNTALAYVQSHGISGLSIASGSAASPLSSPCTIGNCVIFYLVGNGSPAAPFSSVSSPMGTPVLLQNNVQSNTSGYHIEMWGIRVTTGSSTNITASTADASNWSCYAAEFSGGVSALTVVGPTSNSFADPAMFNVTPLEVGDIVLNLCNSQSTSYFASGGSFTDIRSGIMSVPQGSYVAYQGPLASTSTIGWTLSTFSGFDHVFTGLILSPTLTPTVTGVSPSTGPTNGGTSVAITGTNFTGATSVYFGSAASGSFVVNNSTSITATAPLNTLGTKDVTVTTPAGTSATSGSDHFTYFDPQTMVA